MKRSAEIGLSQDWNWARFHRVESPWKPLEPYFSNSWSAYVEHLQEMRRLGFQFVTMSNVLDGNVDAKQVNVILDHHIDFYPIETHVMAAWELQNGFISNIYIFNRFIGGDRARQKPDWNLEDLDVRFLQSLESHGFEIGYHMNSLGLVRTRNQSGHNYSRYVSGEEEFEALEQFKDDVLSLRRFFPVRTYIPHGAGEGNAHLLSEPAMKDNPIRVYNNAKFSGSRQAPIAWKNFTDSTGFHSNVVGRHGATSVINREPLLSNTYLMETGINHELTHPGHYAGGMPYSDFLGTEAISADDRKEIPFEVKESTTTLPIDPTNGHALTEPAPWECDCLARSSPVDYPIFSFTNLEEMIGPHLQFSKRSVPGLIISRKISQIEKDSLKVPRPKSRSLPWDKELDTLKMNLLHNFHYAPNPIRFLNKSHFPIKCLSLEYNDQLGSVSVSEFRTLIQKVKREGGKFSFAFNESKWFGPRQQDVASILENEGLFSQVVNREDNNRSIKLYRLGGGRTQK